MMQWNGCMVGMSAIVWLHEIRIEKNMHELGRLEDLPQDYLDDLRKLNLVPLWPSLRAMLPPGKPRSNTQPTFWSYQALRPLLMRSGELTPIEKAERRVLVLANPGHGLENMKVSAAMYLGMHCCYRANGRRRIATRPTRCA